MERILAAGLKKAVDDIAIKMSTRPERVEAIKVVSITILSELTAAVVFEWESGKRILFYFYYVDVQGGKWWHFMPKDAHFVNMEKLCEIRTSVMQYNFMNHLI